ncbi:Anti-proliferative protein domain-containing protein [Rhodotorula kratochvilovae]
MDGELDAASSFLAAYLDTSAATFSAKLAAVLATRYDGHWHPADPERGSAYRALIRTPASLDSSLVAAAADAGISADELERALAAGDRKISLGDRWTLWVDPGCVSLRIERGDGGVGRDGQLIEIYGKLPESLRSVAVPLASVEAAASSNILPPVEAAVPSSPVKRSKAIQIVAPPGGRIALQAMTNAALQPDSPLRSAFAGTRPTALLASPLIIPPTPVRPLPVAEADVFSPTPSGSLLGPPRSPSPSSGSSTSTGSKSYSLSPSTYRPSSPLGLNTTRRSSSRGSSISSLSADSSDGETSCTDSLFSASGDSTTSAASSIHAAAAQALWKGLDAKSRDLVDADGFRIPALPRALGTQGHSRASSAASLVPPPSPSRTLSPSAGSSGGRSLPGSPTKPRRRGVRGGQSHRSESMHSHHSSISSITSLGSTAIPSTPSQGGMAELAPSPATTPSGRTRTETSSSAQTATEYSNGLVKVLGGGVLLGCAKGAGGARTPGSAGANGEEGSRRRRRERGRGGRGGGGNGGGGANALAGGGDRSGATSPAYGGPHGYPAPPASPGWAPVGVSPYQHLPQAYYGHSPMQA